MLPNAPKDVGRLSDVFVSALGAIVGGELNRLKLPRVKSAGVVLIDGLGHANLRDNLGYASNLRKTLNGRDIPSIRVEFPATTAVSLTSFGTGMRSGSHGIVGYQVVNEQGDLVNMLNSWGSEVAPREWQPHETIAETAEKLDVMTYFVGPKAYEGSGFTEVFMCGSIYVPADSIEERAGKAAELLKQSGNLVYLYFPELDQAAHRFGVDSEQWRAALETVDSAIAVLTDSKGGVILTADHGIVDVQHSKHIYLDEIPGFSSAVSLTGGDPRAAYLYGDPEAIDSALEALEGLILTTPDELAARGWCLPFAGQARVPERILLARGEVAFYDRRTAKAQSLKMVGQHGSIDDEEQRIPLIKLGAFA